MLIRDAQQDLRRAYVGGGPGVVISGLVWLMAAGVLPTKGIGAAFIALFVGGMLIFPATTLVCKYVFRRKSEASANPFGMTVLESTIAMIGGLFAAWLFFRWEPGLVIPLSAIAVGTHYFIFKTTYGDRLFWLLASLVTLIGLGDIYITQMKGLAALLVSATELIFGLALTLRGLNTKKAATGE